jgi:hypothetical protein
LLHTFVWWFSPAMINEHERVVLKTAVPAEALEAAVTWARWFTSTGMAKPTKWSLSP